MKLPIPTAAAVALATALASGTAARAQAAVGAGQPDEPAAEDAAPVVTVEPAPPPPQPADPPPFGGPAPITQAPRPAGDGSWYGWQTLVADGAALSLGVIAAASDSDGLGVASVFAFVLAPPLVHWGRGNVGSGFASLGMRLFMPLGAAVIGALMGGGSNGDNLSGTGFLDGFGSGLIAGYVATVVIDAAFVARDAAPVDAPRPAQAALVIPTLSLAHNQATVGLAGAF